MAHREQMCCQCASLGTPLCSRTNGPQPANCCLMPAHLNLPWPHATDTSGCSQLAQNHTLLSMSTNGRLQGELALKCLLCSETCIRTTLQAHQATIVTSSKPVQAVKALQERQMRTVSPTRGTVPAPSLHMGCSELALDRHKDSPRALDIYL